MASSPPEPPEPPVVPRGRYAPPLEERRETQRQRLFKAAAEVFAHQGYADATAETISRQASMSKATFYEHFANKEECMLALFDHAAGEVLTKMAEATSDRSAPDFESFIRSGIHSMLEQLIAWPEGSQTLFVEIIGAGAAGVRRRDSILDVFATAIHRDNQAVAERYGARQFASEADALACVAGVVELVSRHLRGGKPEDIFELEPVAMRVVLGVLDRGAEPVSDQDS